MIPFPKAFLIPALSLGFISCAPEIHLAENLSAKPFNQRVLADNACGSAALLNSFRFGNTRWRKLSETPPGLSDRDRIRAIARGPAMRESRSLPGRARWSRNGINLSDLRDVANEIASPQMLPAISEETLFLKPGETQTALLSRVRSRLARSLDAGFPPILSIRRHVMRGDRWVTIQGHFVTITSVPGSIAGPDDSFPVGYVDPWGGNFREGTIAINNSAFMSGDPARNPNLQAVFPTAVVGKRLVRSGEESVLAVSAVLGIF